MREPARGGAAAAAAAAASAYKVIAAAEAAWPISPLQMSSIN